MFRKHFLMEEAGGAQGGAPSGAAGANTPSAPAPAVSITAAPAAPAPGVGGAPGGAGGGAGADGGAAPASWMDSIPAELRNDPSIQLFKESGVGGLAKSWVSAQAMLGKDKVIIPGEKATNEEWGAFFNKLGRPESPDKYEFKLPDGMKMNEDFSKGFKEIAHASGMNQKQVQKLVEWYAGQEAKSVEGNKAASQVELKQEIEAYQTRLGGNEKFMAQVDKARQAVRALNDPELNKWLDKSGAGSRPEMIEHFAKLAAMMGEDKLRDGTGVPFGDDPAEIQRQITEIESTMFQNLDSTHRTQWVEQLSKLYARLEASRAPRQ